MFSSSSLPENLHQHQPDFYSYAVRQKFQQLFSHGWDFILKETPESNWKTVKKYKLTEQKCWYKYTDPQKIVGLRFGKETRYGLYDLDWGSKYDPREQEESLRLLKAELELWGIFCLILIQSSDSQGLHLYFFLERPVNTFRLACVMNKAAFEAGLEVKRGQLETFPNTKRYNNLFNGHRLPLQKGSYLLDKDYIPYSDLVEDFLAAADWSAERNDTKLLESRLDEAYEWYKAKKNQERIYNPTPEDREFIEQVEYAQREIKEGFLNKIRHEIEQGFTDKGETNDLLLTIAMLGRILYGLAGQQLIDYIKETVMGCPGYYKYCNHKYEIDRRCRHVARYSEKKWFPYRSRLPKNRPTYKYIKDNLVNKTNLNLERQHNAQSRIIQAVEYIKQQQGKLPQKVGECKLVIRNVTKELFGISVSDATLTKAENLPLWHPKYQKAEGSVNETLNKTSIADVPPTITPQSVIQETLQAEQPNSEQYKDRATPCNVTRHSDSDLKTPKPIPTLCFPISCHTFAYMKGMSLYFLIEIFCQIIQQELSEVGIDKITKEKNNQTSNSKNITKTNGQKISENPPKLDKETLSESQKSYYQEILNRHPELKALDDERQQPEYQKQIKNLFAKVKDVLQRKSQSRMSGLNNLNE